MLWPDTVGRIKGNKLSEAETNLRDVGIVIERPENKAKHSKDVILIKQNASDGEPGNKTLESFPASSPLENAAIINQSTKNKIGLSINRNN